MASNQKELEAFFRELGDAFGSKDKQIFDLYYKIEEKCYQNAKGNPDKFADCMAPAVKKREEEEGRLSFRSEYLFQQLSTCLEENKNDKGKIAQCKESTKQAFGSQLEDYINRLSKQ
mmetsp:Transcript_40689/g.47313  ORF Transcript_40689/g.47313 Transcript_40689/m.47313 type:complete len:117 (+) Transcript_40689:20-370(+)